VRPTVQSARHPSSARGARVRPAAPRWLPAGRVTFVRNVTDIDDKVLQNAD
jgi:cysteinyl-tRNA synthetase